MVTNIQNIEAELVPIIKIDGTIINTVLIVGKIETDIKIEAMIDLE